MELLQGVLTPIFFYPRRALWRITKNLWKKVGGFPDYGENSAEDTDFNQMALKVRARIVRIKEAFVVWDVPSDIIDFLYKIVSYASWDGRYGTFWQRGKACSHTI